MAAGDCRQCRGSSGSEKERTRGKPPNVATVSKYHCRQSAEIQEGLWICVLFLKSCKIRAIMCKKKLKPVPSVSTKAQLD